jgi:hypothetical protein
VRSASSNKPRSEGREQDATNEENGLKKFELDQPAASTEERPPRTCPALPDPRFPLLLRTCRAPSKETKERVMDYQQEETNAMSEICTKMPTKQALHICHFNPGFELGPLVHRRALPQSVKGRYSSSSGEMAAGFGVRQDRS